MLYKTFKVEPSFRDCIVVEDQELLMALKQLSGSQKRFLLKYQELDPSKDVFDLSQNPQFRQRSSKGILSTLTKSCTGWWISKEERCYCAWAIP